MSRTSLLFALLPTLAVAAAPSHFDLSVTFQPPRKAGGEGAVAVTFHTLDPDLRVNETPAPRLKLDLAQLVLADRQAAPSATVPDYDPLTAKYLDLRKPVLFPVAILPGAPLGEHQVKASVVYFYCSQREAWCRRGSADVLIPVTVR
jgi:hypothetical protein